MEITNFIIRKNEYKKSEKQPDYRLSASIDGQWTEIGGGWLKLDKKGNTFISCSISKPKEEKEEKVDNDIKTEDIPF